MSRCVRGLICLLGLAIALTGCGDSKPSAGARKKYRVALVMKSLANEFFQTMEEGAREHEKKNADTYKLIPNGIKDESDVAKQIDIVRQMIADKVDAIVIAPADSKALIPACKEAQDAGIVVVNIDNAFDVETLKVEGVEIPFVGPDNREGARLAGECLAKKLQKGDEVAIIEGIREANNALMRKFGFERAMDDAGMEIVTRQSANWETDQAQKLVANILVEHPQLKALLCANDSMALGAVTAVEAAGKTGSVLIIGYDNIKAVQQLIREGKMLCTVDQHGDRFAALGISHALDMLEGKTQGGNKKTPVDLITADELK